MRDEQMAAEAATDRVAGRARKSRTLRWVGRRCWAVVALFYVGLAFAYAWPAELTRTEGWYVAVSWVAFMYRTFLFHGGLVLAAVGVVAMAARCWVAVVAMIPALVISLGPAAHGCWPRGGEAEDRPMLTVMSANLLYTRAEAARLVEQIRRERPDVIAFQEFTPAWGRELREALGEEYPHRVERARDDAFGQAVYSRRPFVGGPEVMPGVLLADRQPWEEPQIRVTVEHDGKPVAIRDVHLIPPGDIGLTREHRLQAAALAELVGAERGGAVLLGDFNATPTSPHYAAMVGAGLHESHAAAGRGRGTTWPRAGRYRRAPEIRIDHVFFGGGLECVGARVGEDFGSDHRPVVARLRWQAKE